MNASFVINAWIDPDGRVFPLDDEYSQSHEDAAFQVLHREKHPNASSLSSCSDVLFDRGWIEVSERRAHYVFSPRGNITQSQFDTLWDMYLDAKTLTQTIYVKSAIKNLRPILNITVTEG
jgi:hypothetical protein